MPRLRTTATLSVLALVIGAVGTQWLSDQTGSSAEPMLVHGMRRTVMHRAVPRKHPDSTRLLTHVPVFNAPASMHVPVASVASPGETVAWVPLSMPVSSLPYARMRGHDAGSLVLHLVVDGQGQVTQATLAQSSGDAVLDANALVIARHWRFAVPVDHPQGFSGNLPLSFGAGAAEFAQATAQKSVFAR
jgi:periplasmic protein TonB